MTNNNELPIKGTKCVLKEALKVFEGSEYEGKVFQKYFTVSRYTKLINNKTNSLDDVVFCIQDWGCGIGGCFFMPLEEFKEKLNNNSITILQ